MIASMSAAHLIGMSTAATVIAQADRSIRRIDLECDP